MIGTPRSSVSWVALRNMLLSGVTQRMTSSTAVGRWTGSSWSSSHWSWWSQNVRNPWAIAVRVVSAPPDTNRPVSWNIVSNGMGEPSGMVEFAHVERRPSAGHPRSSSDLAATVVHSSCIVAIRSVNTTVSISAASMRISRSLQSLSCDHESSSSRPSSQAVNRAGS